MIFRSSANRWPARQVDLLLKNAAAIEAAFREGAIVVFEDARIRARQLPIGDSTTAETGHTGSGKSSHP